MGVLAAGMLAVGIILPYKCQANMDVLDLASAIWYTLPSMCLTSACAPFVRPVCRQAFW